MYKQHAYRHTGIDRFCTCRELVSTSRTARVTQSHLQTFGVQSTPTQMHAVLLHRILQDAHRFGYHSGVITLMDSSGPVHPLTHTCPHQLHWAPNPNISSQVTPTHTHFTSFSQLGFKPPSPITLHQVCRDIRFQAGNGANRRFLPTSTTSTAPKTRRPCTALQHRAGVLL
jgi:hypothetical protein